MDDTELLERAAQAADIELEDCSCGKRCIRYGRQVHHWNPLENDGDAFQLQVRLLMDVDVSWITLGTVHVFAMASDDQQGGVSLECRTDDAEATTRRAVTMAAARVANVEFRGARAATPEAKRPAYRASAAT